MNQVKGQLQMRVAKIVDHTKQIRELFIQPIEPGSFTFKAGQFVMLHVPRGGELKPAPRAYSIASTAGKTDGFQLVFKYVETGLASEYVWALNEGAVLNFTGPFGKILFQEPPTDQVVFMNTGSGISQHYSMLATFGAKYPNTKFHLFFGLRFEEDLYYQNEMFELARQVPNLKFEYVLSRPSDSWTGGRKGYVQNFLAEFDPRHRPTTFYLCGNGAMIKDTKAQLKEMGFPMERVFAEAFD